MFDFSKIQKFRKSDETIRRTVEFTAWLINSAPAAKREGLNKAVDRTMNFTSDTHMYTHLETYIEGWYIVCEGCQTRWAMWVGDNDGDLDYSHRKPRNLHELDYSGVDWYDLETLIIPAVYHVGHEAEGVEERVLRAVKDITEKHYSEAENDRIRKEAKAMVEANVAIVGESEARLLKYCIDNAEPARPSMDDFGGSSDIPWEDPEEQVYEADHDYSPSCPWNAPGMKVSDFI